MTLIPSKVDTRNADFQANAEQPRSLGGDLHARMAAAALGGGEKARTKHTERGKSLPRECLRALFD
ncbi:MAG: hypothetical protein LBQ20_04450 [Rhodanobacter sp.]|jgi:3-methylcrotonyl-CoA carboxylase beta subunit|nr:hypothetical protein [Rhodanobacter sp.]